MDVLMNMKAVNCISNGLTSEGIWYYHRFNPVGLWTELMHMHARMCFRLSIFGAVELLNCIYWFFRWDTRLTVRNFYLERFFATCIRCFCWGYLQEANWRYGEQTCGNEPYELKMCTQYFSASVAENTLGILETTNYDLRSAVKRQNSFFIR